MPDVRLARPLLEGINMTTNANLARDIEPMIDAKQAVSSLGIDSRLRSK